MASHDFGETGDFPALVLASAVQDTHFVDIVDDPAFRAYDWRLVPKLHSLTDSLRTRLFFLFALIWHGDAADFELSLTVPRVE